MAPGTISTFELFQRFPDAESARLYLEGRLWHRAAFMHGCVCHVLEPSPALEGKCLPCAAREAIGSWRPDPERGA